MLPQEGHSYSSTFVQSSNLTTFANARFDTTTNNIHSPGCPNQRPGEGVIENDRFDNLQSPVGCGRGQDGILEPSIHLSGVHGTTEKSVVEHVLCAR